MKKGFTLIELLAVILILGIIALIAIPAVNNIINDAKLGAWKVTAESMINAYEQQYELAQLKGENLSTTLIAYNTTGVDGATVKSDLNIKGDLPEKVYELSLDANGNAVVEFSDGKFYCTNRSGAVDCSVTTTGSN